MPTELEQNETQVVQGEVVDEAEARQLSQAMPRTTQTLATVEPPSPAEWEALRDQAKVLSKTGLVPEAFQGKADDIVVVLLAGRELRVPPITAMQEIHAIKGRPALSAKLMTALVQRSGHEIYVDPGSDENKATAHGKRKGSDRWEEFTFSMEDARKAGLLNSTGKMYEKYPKAMLIARAISGLCRKTFADVVLGFGYTPEEAMEAAVGIEHDPTEVPTRAILPSPDKPLEGVHPEWLEKLVAEHGTDNVLAAAQAFINNPDRRLKSLHDLNDMPMDVRIALAKNLHDEQSAAEGEPEPTDTGEAIAGPNPDADHCYVHETRDDKCTDCKWSGTAMGSGTTTEQSHEAKGGETK